MSGATRSGPRSVSRVPQSRNSIAIQWRRDDAYGDVSASEFTISVPSSSTFATTPTESSLAISTLDPCTSQSSDPLTTPSSVPVSQITVPANIPVPSAASTSALADAVPIHGGVYGPVAPVSTSLESLPTDAKPVSSTSGPSAGTVGGIYQAPYSSPDSASPTADPETTLSAATDPTDATSSSVGSSTLTTFSLKLFPPGYPTPEKHSVPVSSLSSDSSFAPLSSSSSGTNTDSSRSVVPTVVPHSTTFGPNVTFGGSTIFPEPSNTLSFTVGYPGDSTATTTTGSRTSAVFATSSSFSRTRTFAYNTGGIVGVAFGAAIALLLGVLLTLCVCQRSKRLQKHQLSKLWISPPSLQKDDGLDDAYSPVARRSVQRRSPDLLRPLSFQSVEHGGFTDRMPVNTAYDTNDDHYDTDTWRVAPTPPPAASAASNSPSPDPLSPEFYTPSTPSPEPTLKVISAKGFMRRLRRGRPSLASRGLLTTLTPVVESPYSPRAVCDRD
ncbi:hypothetical protein MVEN_01767500 [Mycena venus]|uniref:Uncharacterized protein n=1 Tax=Mycena venus TaxID=2733690 RepID=A0A8H6XLR1_9AGAR|nr:hypothetical protein MVEN_01767500 [Mycena venus]